MIKILSIGNSYSFDAHARLYGLANSAGCDIYTVNPYIGGCSLEKHHKNMLCDLGKADASEKNDYAIQENGVLSQKHITLLDAVRLCDWDIVTFQQQSAKGGQKDSFYPYINELSDYVKKLCPGAKQYMFQTWAYEKDFEKPSFDIFERNQEKMTSDIKDAYSLAAESIGACGIIPCGEVIAKLRESPLFDIDKGGDSLCRDKSHMSLVYGRFALAAAWLEYLLGISIYDARYNMPAVDVDGNILEDECKVNPERLELIKKVVHEICGGNRAK